MSHPENDRIIEKLKGCNNDCYDEGEQQVETLCIYCQDYLDSVRGEALRDYKVSPEYWAWHAKNNLAHDREGN